MNRITPYSCRPACLTTWLTLAGASTLLWPTVRTAAAAEYTFVNIADSSGLLGTTFGWPTINDDGTVAFWNIRDDGSAAIYTGNGGPLTLQVTNQGPFTGISIAPTINSAGAVAFRADSPLPVGVGVYSAINGVVTTIDDASTGPFYDFSELPSINNSGNVAFSGNILSPFGSAIGSGSGVMYDTAGAFLVFTSHVTMNNSGRVAFIGTFDGGGGSGLFSGTGGAFTTIASFGGTYTSISSPGNINDNGEVAFLATLAGGTRGIFVGSGGPVTTIATTAGPYSSFSPNGVAFNNNGQVAFYATLDAGGVGGIYTGPNPATDKVIKTGDPLFGSTVFGGLNVVRGMNNHGDIAFNYILPNASGGTGVHGIAVAKVKTAALLGDLNGDGHVNGIDLALLLGQWTGSGSYAPCPRFASADLNHDCKVNGLDLALLLGAWG